jgi:4-hydroxybenzoate polyprenyltransferase
VVPVAAVLVLGIHLADTIPDLEMDAEAGVRGLAHRLGMNRAVALCWGAFLGAVVFTLLLWPFLSYQGEWYVPGVILAVILMGAGVVLYRAKRIPLKLMALLLEVGALALAVGWVGAILL